MNLFRLVRLGIWSCLLALCIVIVASNFAAHRAFISPEGLRTIADRSNAYQIVRDNVIAPQIQARISDSPFAHLLPQSTVQAALAKSLTTEQLQQMSPPVIDGMYRWLDSKEPRVAFTINSQNAVTRFTDALAGEVNAAIAKQPECTYQDSYLDMTSGRCRSELLSNTQRESLVKEAVQSASAAIPTAVTEQTITVPATLSRQASNLPTYLNMLYALHLIALAMGGMIVLWLLFKWRLRGIAAIGVSALLGALGISVVALTVKNMSLHALSAPYDGVARAATTLTAESLQMYVAPLLLGGAASLLIGIGGIILWRRYHHDGSVTLSDKPRQNQV